MVNSAFMCYSALALIAILVLVIWRWAQSLENNTFVTSASTASTASLRVPSLLSKKVKNYQDLL